MKEHREAIASILEDEGYHVMAQQARHETNEEILKGYVAVLKAQAKKRNDNKLTEKLWHYGLIA